MGDLLLPGGGPIFFPRKNEPGPDDDFDKYVVCSDCNTHMLLGDEDLCPVCKKAFCEECFEDHDCGFMQAQAEATYL